MLRAWRDEKEAKAIDKLFGSACCSLDPRKAACWTQFDRKAVIHACRQSLELTKDELDLVILGNIQAGRSNSRLLPAEPGSTSRRTAIYSTYGGKRICPTHP